MQFASSYIPAILLRRYKRFLADVELSDGQVVTVHTPNTGAMLGVSSPGIRIWLRDTLSSTRKYRYSWEISEPAEQVYVGVHTGIVNVLVTEAIQNGIINELQGYPRIEQEVGYGAEKSRIDLMLQNDKHRCYVEIKNVTARDIQGNAIFPDAVSTRGQKHLRELMRVVETGDRAVIFYCIQRGDIDGFRPADEIDSEYGRLLRTAVAQGVDIFAYKAAVTPTSIRLTQSVPIRI
ncbi:MAG: DNA/RNA nuclease SfsA [Gammaproteobacteria bacterium]|nr:DNA/RNA nuclease SfsA [Gammaproteobacteria bacterium]